MRVREKSEWHEEHTKKALTRRGDLDKLEPRPHTAPTPVQPPQAGLSCVIQGLLKLALADLAVDVGKLRLGLRFPGRIILVHHVDVRTGRNLAEISGDASDRADHGC
jgi:hypothetical protein